MCVTTTTIHINLSLSAWDIFSGTDVCNNYIYNIYNDRPLQEALILVVDMCIVHGQMRWPDNKTKRYWSRTKASRHKPPSTTASRTKLSWTKAPRTNVLDRRDALLIVEPAL